MDLTTIAGAGAGGDGENPEDGEVGIISLSEKNLPYWKIPRYSLAPALKYRECLKNHAATLGGHAVDGCGEFLPSPEGTPSEPRSLECAACGCHRNFHRRDDDSVSTTGAAQFLSFRHNPIQIPLLPPHILIHPIRSRAPEDQETAVNKTAENRNGRKRHRTKFTRDQKEKMLCFAERMGWKLQKSDELTVDEFCNEIGVGKGVLKVWMHNNKQTVKKTDINLGAGAGTDNSGIPSFHSDNGCAK